jgi:hypothetical protein
MSKPMRFIFRAWISSQAEDIIERECFVDELEQSDDPNLMDAGHDRLRAHLDELDRAALLEMVGESNAPKEAAFQILVRGQLVGEWQHTMDGDEFDEWMEVDSCMVSPLPADWFTRFFEDGRGDVAPSAVIG